ncbi:integron integrase [Candidatus Vecturithrix granuli]|uniref:Integron integrase n=1 Tax=Vecturithrix granuli TaxID=1499967 RepID=A0A0S6WBG7_VECG1|nr:integron integrase [Candidatus Vecturithrix granuli]
MTTQEFSRRLSQSDSWQQLRPATRAKYLYWFRCYMEFLRQNPVKNLSTQQKITRFLSQRLMESSANTKRQAIAAVAWLYTHILHKDISPPRVKKPRQLPLLFSKQETAFELSKLPIRYQFMGWLFYGSGLRLNETVLLKHEQIAGAQIHLAGRTLPIPLCRQAIMLYASLKQPEGYVFPAKTTPDKPGANTLFLHACRSHGVDRRITPGALRANFILLALEKNGIPWTQAVTGLSTMRINQYLKMIPPKAKSPLDVFGASE